MCAKYGRSRMNDVHTISPVNFVGRPAKGIQSTALFLKRRQFLYDFRVGHWPADLGVST